VDLAADRAEALRLTPVTPDVLARLDRFVALLLDWKAANLVASSTIPRVWTRHVADSLQLLRLAPAAATWVDLGSGGGFPGLVLACALAARAGAHVHLVESHGRKCAFLREAARIAAVPAIVHNERIETFAARWREPVDAVTARALAPLPRLLELAAPLMQSGAQGVFPKGQDVEAELTQTAKSWNIAATLVPSLTDPRARIVVVRSAQPLRNRK
jgi:16S rRNA (guanine527-N7)-methyltransferase